ncbi:AmpG family muropeptide MFS transporter [Taylorella equigenitalis]|uniref:AmpG family muropeptide MFS transporter n=1 Tax=Taylorella equigenitalis TaxID=29575 RepID=UPI00237E8BD2|nr:MFS transporter [Taylorella equigenitalis]WDU51712.1 MFS transporter [Taylorella equigenitalis]WEE00266.1 MFS transporter [Taylorella equigenitalis]WEE01743.1 MFS transporter [Taylorella equigenitalis]WFD78280.1 MFS transporter [Taylorella equigenitalis]WFD79758.1 MFS transporter [Taylorella equigenitalis]
MDKPSSKQANFKNYLNPRVLPLLFLGIASGLPLALTGGTLQAWATVSGVSLKSIGFLTLVGTAYTFKFLWAPFIDRYAPPLFGRRRGWMALTQVLLGICLICMGFFNPGQELNYIAIIATVIAFLSATQDIAFDAYSTEVLESDEKAHGAAIRTLGYRIGMIVSGGFAIVIAERWLGWQATYQLMGVLMFVFAVITAVSPEVKDISPPRSLAEAFINPLVDFFSRKEAIAILLLIVLYKLGDSFAGALSTTFLIRGAGFAAETVGWVNKILAVLSSIFGALLGGALLNKLGLYKSLMSFGILQSVSNLMYALVAITGKSLPIMALAVGLENFTGGMGTAAFVVLIMGLCNIKFTATQFALLTALSSVGRVFLAGPLTPPLVEYFGWAQFFVITAIIALPGLVLLYFQRNRIKAISLD